LRLYLVRHGQSLGALQQGLADPDLTDLGKRQARLVAERLRLENIALLVCSPLRRSLRTAQIISSILGLRPQVWPDLMESYDGGGGMTRSEIAAEFPGFTVNIPEQWWPEEPEDEERLYARAAGVEAKVRLLGHETDIRIAAVGHGTFGAALMSNILGAPPCGYTRFSQNNCCVSILELRPGRAKLIRSNDVSHLGPDLLT